METVFTCPLGSECEEAKDGKLYRCQWYIALRGKDPQSEKEIDEWGCSMKWLPTLLVENAQTNRGQTAALESLRNEMTKGRDMFGKVLQVASKMPLPRALEEKEVG